MFRLICNRPELNIRIYDPITSYLTSPHTFNANIALNLSLLTFIIQRYFKRIRRSLYSIPAERRSAGTLPNVVIMKVIRLQIFIFTSGRLILLIVGCARHNQMIFASALTCTTIANPPAQWQRSASYESEKLKVKNEKSKCIVVSTCKHYVCNWIFHSSLFVLHLKMLL